ncbi:TRAP transporter large permease [Paracandidimonas soli]|uniref:TRAP transporter large permease protein n=1 Tax=Paracandidimonas soli TaxID=1917182 RepID=A0A4R3V2W4_9BURK|nr:TRAP transporter large permease [Paracandidimonas soli]TCU99146.1 C4-dicarboxylate transporter DctM subunit [Paracandidimonas soli]
MLLLFGSLILCFAIGIPIFAALGIAAGLVLVQKDISLLSVPQNLFEALDAFPLMAIPFYVLAGSLMQNGGISRRLMDLANAIVGWIRGGLGSASVLTSMFFSTMSGSSSATTAAVGGIMIPAMEKKGYPRNFAAAGIAVAGELGAIIPPSLPMIIYALVANVSVGSMFLAGIFPGLMLGVSLIVTIAIVAKLKNFDDITPITPKAWIVNVWRALLHSGFALMMPVIILGGIYSGIFTATEASVVAVVYGLLVGMFVYKEIRIHDLRRIFAETAILTGTIMLIVGFASLFAYLLAINNVSQHLSALIGSVASNAFMFLLLANVLLLVIGMFMEALACIVILGPMLAPIAASYGIDPIHFGMVIIFNVAIGMVTPPVGVNLFIACQISGLSLEQLIRPLLIFLAVLIMNLMIVSYVPAISLALL